MSDCEDRTIFVGNLSDQITDSLLYELFFQAGPVERVNIPKDPKSGRNRNFGFVVYVHKESVPYAIDLFSTTALCDRKLNLKNAKVNGGGGGGGVDYPRDSRSGNYTRPSLTLSSEALRHGYQPQNFSPNQLLPPQQSQPLPPVIPAFDPNLLLQLGANFLMSDMMSSPNTLNNLNQPYPQQNYNDNRQDFKMNNRHHRDNHRDNHYNRNSDPYKRGSHREDRDRRRKSRDRDDYHRRRSDDRNGGRNRR